METISSPIELLIEKAEEYSKTSIELIYLNALDKSADVASSLLSRLAVLMVMAMFVFIVSMGLALWVGEILGKTYLGFFVVGGAYCLIALLLHALRHQLLKTPISNAIITQIQKQKMP